MERSEYYKSEQDLTRYIVESALIPSSQTVDAATQALNEAYAFHFNNDPLFRANFIQVLEARTDISPSDLGRRGFKAIVAAAMTEQIDTAAESVDAALIAALQQPNPHKIASLARRAHMDDWESTFAMINYDPQTSERYLMNLHLPNTANPPERSKLIKAVTKLYMGEKTHPLRFAIMGSSIGNDFKMLLVEGVTELLTYKRTPVMRRVLTESGVEYQPDATQTDSFNKLIHGSNLLIRDGVGVDILDFNNRMFTSWALSNCRYISELTDTRLSQQYSAVTTYNPHNYSMVMQDVTEMDPADIGEPADVSYFGFMLHQLVPDNKHSSAEVEQALQTAIEATKDEGIVMIYDFCDLDQDGKPLFYKNWPNWSASVLVFDKKHPDKGWQKVLSVKNGRTSAVVVENAAHQAPYASTYDLAT